MFNLSTESFLLWQSALKGYNPDWLARCHHTVIGWCTRVLCLLHGASVLEALKIRSVSCLMQHAATVVIWLKSWWKRRQTTHTHTNTHTHTHTHIYTHIHIHTHKHTHTATKTTHLSISTNTLRSCYNVWVFCYEYWLNVDIRKYEHFELNVS